MLSSFLISSQKKGSEILFTCHSDLSGAIEIREGEYGRELWVDGANQSTRILKDTRANYWQCASEYASVKNKDKILVLGLGGGEIIRRLNEIYNDLQVTAVELDPIIVDLYKKYFKENKNKRIDIVVGDAYKYILRNKRKYNAVFCDVYFKGTYPKEFLEHNFLWSVKNSLRKEGQYISNRIFALNPKRASSEYEGLLKLYFKNVYCKYVGGTTLNYVFFANI